MDKRIVQFIIALRNSGVRVSLAESIDAFNAIDKLGIEDRETFRMSLRTTLIKNNQDLATFDKLFPLFFQSGEPQNMTNPSEDLSEQEAQMIADALRQFTEQMRNILQKMLRGEPLTQEELQALEADMDLDQITDLRYQKWLANRMEQAMKFDEVKQAVDELMQMLAQMGMDPQRREQMRQMLQGNQQALHDQIEQYVGRKIAENLSKQERTQKADELFNRPFEALSEDDMRILRKEVGRLAAALRTRLALRLKRARTGQLDVKGTLRKNLKHGSVPLLLQHRDKVQKPRIVVLCDVSTSMRHISELMLSFLYSVQDQISKTNAFAFIDHLEYISEFFENDEPNKAVSEVLQKMPSGHYNTDLGFSLQNFSDDYLGMVDNRTTFIVVGDGRNNYNDPALDIFQDISRRSRALIWLNPEDKMQWGRGDSDMLKYAQLCGRVFHVSNLAELTEAVDELLVYRTR